MKEKSLVGFPLGILKRMEMPRFMKGLVKSMTASLAKLMVMAPTARSALPSTNSEFERISWRGKSRYVIYKCIADP